MTGTTSFVDLVEVRPGLGARARAVAGELIRRGLTGHRVLVLLPPGAEYVATLLGCFYAGAVAVPVHPHDSGRLAEIVDDAQPAAAIGLPLTNVRRLSGFDGDAREWRHPDVGPDTLALLQYARSGPVQGVMLSQANLAAAATQLVRHVGMRASTGVVSYLPPYSDLGLVGGVLAPLLTGARVTLLPADTTPGEWLRMVSLRRAAISFAPDLAYAWHTIPGGLAGTRPAGQGGRHEAREPRRGRAGHRDRRPPHGDAVPGRHGGGGLGGRPKCGGRLPGPARCE